jgi:chemotaxis signal transduction protein
MERNSESSELAEIVAASFKWNGGDIFVLDVERLLSRVEGEAAG